MDGVSDRVKLRVPPRVRPSTTIKVGLPAVVKSRLPEEILKKELRSFQENNKPMALPTIPIMKYVSTIPIKEPVNSLAKPVPGSLIDGSFNRRRELLKLKQARPETIGLMTKSKLPASLDQEPDTKPLPKDHPANKASKIIRHRKPNLKQLPLAVIILFIISTVSYISYDSWQLNQQIAIENKQSSSLVLGSAVKQIDKEFDYIHLDGIDKLNVKQAQTSLLNLAAVADTAYYDRDVILVNYDSFASLIGPSSQIKIKENNGVEVKYQLKNSWSVKHISNIFNVLPAKGELSIIARQPVSDNQSGWLVITLKTK